MSTSRGNHIRRRPQKHQNKSAFKNDLHDTSKKTKQIKSIVVSGVCKHCKDVIEWKIKYKKYKPLSAPSKCVGCEEKNVKHAYHILCNKCAKERSVCAKCNKQIEDEIIQKEDEDGYNTDLKSLLKSLPERKRRTVIRHIQKQDEKVNIEILEEMLSKLWDVNDDVDNEDDLSFGESEE